MKCPKCSYLGFETGDRCKNCGYDFSLMSVDDAYSDETDRGPLPDYDIRADLRDSDADASSEWLDEIDPSSSTLAIVDLPEPPRMMLAEEPAPSSVAPVFVEPTQPQVDSSSSPKAQDESPRSPLPLFRRDDDEPLVRLPAAPRPPLSVRRAPDSPVQRVVDKQVRRQTPDRDHVLLFGEEHDALLRERDEPADPILPSYVVMPTVEELLPSGVQPRVVAALIDHGILFAIDLAVVYFTLRMAALSFGDWARLPPVPMLAFLVLVKLAYFSAFTSVGGQTIGKMAAGIRVVSDAPGGLEISRALQRAAAVLISLVTLGIGFLPALFASDRRALHDRIAHTRVVTLPSA